MSQQQAEDAKLELEVEAPALVPEEQEVAAALSDDHTEEEEEVEEADPLHIGNTISILSDKYGLVTGRIVYRDLTTVRLVPQDASDRALEFPMLPDGSKFQPDLGVTDIEIIEEQVSDYYVDVLGARPGETLEFFTMDGEEAAPDGVVEEVIKTSRKDAIKLTDGRVISFRGMGPALPIALIRVRASGDIDAMAAEETEADADALEAERRAAATVAAGRQNDILALLRSVLPAATVEVVPTAEMSFPDSMQREDLLQDLKADMSAKQSTNPRRIRFIEREVDLAMSLKNKSVIRDDAGRVVGAAKFLIDTIADAVGSAVLPAAIPIVSAARILNLDDANPALSHKQSDVVPRSLAQTLSNSELISKLYEDSAAPEFIPAERVEQLRATMGRGFYSYIYDLMDRDQQVLSGGGGAGWREEQDVIRTAGLSDPVQGLSSGLPGVDENAPLPVSLAHLISDVTDRIVRVLPADMHVNAKTGERSLIAPSDPSSVVGYVMLPTKAALALRPPKRPGDLPTALLYSAALEHDNLPTLAQTLTELYSSTAGSPLNAWTIKKDEASEFKLAEWLETVLRYAIHPADSLGPRTPRILSVLDTYGLGESDLSPSVTRVINKWVRQSQQLWRDLLVAKRKEIQKLLDAEEARTFQSVTGPDSPLWLDAEGSLTRYEGLQDVLEDIRRRNPTISSSPTLMTAAFLQEAQGDVAPIVWAAIANIDARPAPVDVAAATAALSASRAYILRRKALQDFALLTLKAEPEVSTCPHAKKLEAYRNVQDVLQRSRLMREFIEEYQGGKKGDWMTCALCTEPCVCYHEIMELEALAQPSRMAAIQKQMLIRFGGERYLGKIVCKNCGQALQDIDYDDHVEFDDEGRPITGGSVLTEEQMADDLGETELKKTMVDLAITPAITFATQAQRELGDALQVIIERAGMIVHPDIIRQIVRLADLYVNARAPPAAAYEAQRAKMMTAAATKIKLATGTGVASIDVPTYAAVLDQLRVSALAGLTTIFLQAANPAIQVNNPFPLCRYSREGWPLNPEVKPDLTEPSAVLYVSCAVASIQRDITPWRNLNWAGEPKLETRQKKVFATVVAATQLMLVGDPKTGPLSFTAELRTLLATASADVAAIEKRTLVSINDQLPPGFRPEPFPPKMAPPAFERDPIEQVTTSTESLDKMIGPIATAVRVQSLAVIGDLHKASDAGLTQRSPTLIDTVCCPMPIAEVAAGGLRGREINANLLVARDLLRGSIPSITNAGTHLWPIFETPVPLPVEQVVDNGVFFKLFLKYCYRGSQVGDLHEFSLGNVCRQCGMALGKPLDLIDFNKEGAGIMAAQQGDLRIEITTPAFEALSDAIRRRKLLEEPVMARRAPWVDGLRMLVKIMGNKGEALAAVLDAIPDGNAPMDEVTRATVWSPIAMWMDTLKADISERIGPAPARQPGKVAQDRARETVVAFNVFNSLTEDPFIEGPRALQEYWCAKAEAAGREMAITKVTGAKWFKLSYEHNERLNKILTENSMWYGGILAAETRPILQKVAESLGPLLHVWIKHVRPSQTGDVGPWTAEEAQMLLRTLVLQVWRDALSTDSWMYDAVTQPAQREKISAEVGNWTRALMFHVKGQYVKYSKERIRQILQQRAELERTSVVEEFENIKDDDQRAATLLQKKFGIGRWAMGKNIQKLDPDRFEFENEQRRRMGIIDAPVDPILLEGAAAAGGNDYGFGLDAGPEDGYDANQEAEDDA